MNFCDSGHDEIVFIGRACPLCEKIAEAEQAQLEAEQRIKEIAELKEQLAESSET